jgi:hypothetical protein
MTAGLAVGVPAERRAFTRNTSIVEIGSVPGVLGAG